MSKRSKFLTVLIALITVLCLTFALTGCGGAPEKYVVGIEQGATENGVTTYSVNYSDGSVSTFTASGGKDGANGKDGKDVSVSDIYQKYLQETGENLSYSEFLEKYLTFGADNSAVIAKCLSSVLKIYTEFVETSRPSMWITQTDTMIYTGSAVIYSIDEEDDGYTYMITNYHVVYDSKADKTANGGKNTARKIYAYLYGSESSPSNTGTRDEDGYTAYEYGDYAIECEYIGGTVANDLAVIRAKTSDLKALNPDIRAAEISDEAVGVGQTAIAIGNPEDAGISVTEGIISVDAEYISLSIDGTKRSYRSIRIDTALYSGNSGGGLFDKNGKLIGITNAGDTSDQNINYAIPLPVVLGTADNIIYRFFHPLNAQDYEVGAYKIALGVTVTSSNSKYVYDPSVGTGKIVETVTIAAVSGIAESLGLQEGDVITAISVGGRTTPIERNFDISDVLLTVRENDRISVSYVRNDSENSTAEYTVRESDLAKIA